MEFCTAEQAVAAIGRGEIVVVVDDEQRENEGDLILAAQYATPERIAFLVRHTSGLICVAVDEARADALQLPLMVPHGGDARGTAFTVTVDLKEGTTTGISASDRAATICAVADPATQPQDLTRPGHVHVLRARDGGVLKRAGHTEAAVDLARAAGCEPAGVLCEIVTENGLEMARGHQLVEFARRHGLLLVSIAELIAFRRRTEELVVHTGSARLPTPYGEFVAHSYTAVLTGEEHLALVMGQARDREGLLVRVHSECLTGDVFGSQRCDCGPQLKRSMELIAAEGCGVVVYLKGHEGRGIGLGHKLRAYALQEGGLDTVEANVAQGLPVDSREYGIGAQILSHLGVRSMRCLTNNPAKYSGLLGFGLRIVERVPLESRPTAENIAYLRTKQRRMGHMLTAVDVADSAELVTTEAREVGL